MKKLLAKINARVNTTMDSLTPKEMEIVVQLHMRELVKYTHDMNRCCTFVWITDLGEKALGKKRSNKCR